MKFAPKFFTTIFAVLLPLLFSQTAYSLEKTDIVVSIAPLHSLVANITDGVVEPQLMLAPNKSPHNYVLKPSDARKLANAKIVFWIGPQLESFLAKPIKNIAAKAKVTALLETPHSQENDQDDHAHGNSAHDTGAHGAAAHIWLDPTKAKHMVKEIAAALVKSDPANAQTYRKNLAGMITRLAKLDEALQKKLADAQAIHVYHNAYQQFADRYHIKIASVMTNNPAIAPSAKKIKIMRDKLATKNARCIFIDPQTNHNTVKAAIANSHTKIVTLDPLGVNIPAGPDQYFTLLNNLADAITSCNMR